jgi:hypothetical protein
MGLVHFDQATKHFRWALYMRAPLSLGLSLRQAHAGPSNQTHPEWLGDSASALWWGGRRRSLEWVGRFGAWDEEVALLKCGCVARKSSRSPDVAISVPVLAGLGLELKASVMVVDQKVLWMGWGADTGQWTGRCRVARPKSCRSYSVRGEDPEPLSSSTTPGLYYTPLLLAPKAAAAAPFSSVPRQLNSGR